MEPFFLREFFSWHCFERSSSPPYTSFHEFLKTSSFISNICTLVFDFSKLAFYANFSPSPSLLNLISGWMLPPIWSHLGLSLFTWTLFPAPPYLSSRISVASLFFYRPTNDFENVISHLNTSAAFSCFFFFFFFSISANPLPHCQLNSFSLFFLFYTVQFSLHYNLSHHVVSLLVKPIILTQFIASFLPLPSLARLLFKTRFHIDCFLLSWSHFWCHNILWSQSIWSPRTSLSTMHFGKSKRDKADHHF